MLRPPISRLLLLVGGMAATVGGPPLLMMIDPPTGYHLASVPFEYFGFFGTLFVLAVTWYVFQSESPQYGGIFPFVFMVVMLVHLGMIAEYSEKSFDYGCYENAAKLFVAGGNPYDGGFLYPPPVLQSIVSVYHILNALASRFSHSFSEAKLLWGMVFYFYQCCQFFLVMGLFLLLHKFSLRLGFPAQASVILVALLLLLDNPLLRTLRFNQINLWVLDASLVAILLLPRHAFLAGVTIACASTIKLYPVTLFLPLLLKRNWKALLGGAATGGGIFLLSTLGGREFTLYGQFIDKILQTKSPVHFFRDNSPRGLIANTLSFMPSSLQLPTKEIVAVAYALSIVVFVIWFLVRFRRRDGVARIEESQGHLAASALLHDGHLVDMCALGLLISPLVWEHHYVMALPLILWALSVSGPRQWLAVIGTFLIIAIPTFDLYPFSYHRILGLGLLLVAAHAESIPQPSDLSTVLSEIKHRLVRRKPEV